MSKETYCVIIDNLHNMSLNGDEEVVWTSDLFYMGMKNYSLLSDKEIENPSVSDMISQFAMTLHNLSVYRRYSFTFTRFHNGAKVLEITDENYRSDSGYGHMVLDHSDNSTIQEIWSIMLNEKNDFAFCSCEHFNTEVFKYNNHIT